MKSGGKSNSRFFIDLKLCLPISFPDLTVIVCETNDTMASRILFLLFVSHFFVIRYIWLIKKSSLKVILVDDIRYYTSKLHNWAFYRDGEDL